MADGPSRVLVVEDDPDLLWLMTHALESAGLAVIKAFGAADALRKVKAQMPDLIVTDLAMPQMSGAELIFAVKADPQTAGIPCIAVTAFLWDHIAGSAKAAGCDGFIAKPFTAARLRQEVLKLLAVPRAPRVARAG
jgi:two-component system cell cycle response regulator DivK